MDMSDASWLANFSIAIIDIENMANNPDCLRRIRAKNPKIILVGKINLTEIILPTIYRPIQSKFILEIGSLESKFLLRNAAGGAVYAPRKGGGYIFNISADCPPASNGYRYNQLLSNFLIKYVFSAPVWDGLCVSPEWENAYGIASEDDSPGLDADGDGQKDENCRFFLAWRLGVENCIDSIKHKRGEQFIVIGDPRQSKNSALNKDQQAIRFTSPP